MPQRAPLPVGKPILVRLDRIPAKTREKAKFRGEGVSVVVDLPMLVDDKTKAEHFEQVVFWSMPDRIRSGNGEFKPTGSYKFIEAAIKPSFEVLEPEQRAQALQGAMAIYDGNYFSQLTSEQKAPLLKHYVVYMKDAKTDDQGRVWEDPKEIKQVSELEWEVEERRMPLALIREQVGLPKPVAPPPVKVEDKPQTAPEEPPGPTVITDEQMAEVRVLMTDKLNGAAFVKKYLAKAEAERVGYLTYQQAETLLTELRNQPPKNPGF